MAHGTAVGAHLALGMAGILAVSLDAGAQYGFPEIRAGLSPEAMATYYLSRRIGLGPALYMALTGALISGAEARASGLADAALALADLSKVELNLRQWVAAHPGPIRRRDVIEALRREEPPYVQTSENTGATILEDLLASPPLWETLLQHLEGLESARSSPLSALAASILRDWEHFFAPALYVTHKLMRDHMAIPFEVALRTERDILRRLVEQSPFPVLAKQMLWPPNNHRPAKSREHLHQLDRHLIAEIFGGA
jgi:enoyl-CoA hydratase/carnithine racemase